MKWLGSSRGSVMTRKEYNKICAKRVYDTLLKNVNSTKLDEAEFIDILDYLYDIINDTNEMRDYVENEFNKTK